MFARVICIQMVVYMAAYSHIYPYMHHLGAREARNTNTWYIHSQEAGARYTGTVQRYPTSLQRAVAPTELPGQSDNQLRQVLYK